MMASVEVEPVGVGVVGAGSPNIATSCQLPAMKDLGSVRIVGLCDRLETVQDFAAEYGAMGFLNYDEMLRHPAVEMVQVATPDWCHADHAISAMEAGKHVLVQKPLAVTRVEAAKMVEAARLNGVRLQVLLANRWRDVSLKAKRFIDEGVIGKLVHMEYKFIGRRFPISDSKSPYLSAKLGGVWLHNGLHTLDEAMLYTDSLPSSIHMMTQRNACGDPRYLGDHPNHYLAHIDFDKGQTMSFEYNAMLLQDGLPSWQGWRLIGTEGELRVDRDPSVMQLFRRTESEPMLVPVDASHASVIDAFRSAIDQFARTIRDGQHREPCLRSSLYGMETLWRGLESAETGAVLPIEWSAEL